MDGSASEPSARSRRGFLLVGAAGLAAAGAAVITPGTRPAHAVDAPAVGATDPGATDPGGKTSRASTLPNDRGGVDVRDHGAVADGVTDDTAAFARAVEAARVARGRVLVPAGTYVIDSITVPLLVAIEGLGADVSRYGASTDGGVNLRHLPRSTKPMIVVDGNGVTLEGLTLQGNGSTAPLVQVVNGFESRFDRVQLAGVAGTALVVERVNNNLWSDLFVNDCGSADAAAVVLRSPASGGTNTNTFTCVNLHVEGSANVALDLAWGATAEYFVEFVRLIAPHIETLQRAGSGNDATVRIGNVRQVEFVAPTIYGGPGPLIEHHEMRRRGVDLDGGIRLLGGALLGADPAQVGASSVLVRLTKGDDFALVGTRLGRFTKAGVELAEAYGSRFAVDPTARIATTGSAVDVDDRREVEARPLWAWGGDLAVGRRLLGGVTGTAPVISAMARNGVDAPSPTLSGSDLRGTVAFGSGRARRRGTQVRVRYSKPFATAPVVSICPESSVAASAEYFVVSRPDAFDVEVVGQLADDLPADAYRFTYQIIG
ncbi:glycosyl hydrolase family 28-related protein [Frigoribacterium sp. PhB24]|uniref:glycosyl hydrolase family 28-related protein n=1 Tax=Frigoribacterium sp. PhB24 TaxID=2485204 RepID=UPI000FBEEAB3|nr:glycosyl hydrolase family 28-related protein [Frigoribacterium sp. PhB24]ROS48376.1 pectate lyase-like protein [Frigoribacterium sp. PhB24]